MYADGSVHFNGGSFLGLQYVYNLLKTRAYSYVDFAVDFAHRTGSDPTATIAGPKLLTDPALDIMNKYDQVWFFGIESTPNLTPPEVALLTQFMAGPKFGGVLVTGDHDNLGRGIAGQIPRAGVMRLYHAPPNTGPSWNTTLEEGPDLGSTYDFDDQSDDKPQTIRWKRYTMASPFILTRRYRTHPVLCGPDGPVNFLPDHQHEGEALAPTPAPGDPVWPTLGGHQEVPEVIAWGTIKDPSAIKHGQEIGVISAYNGHNVNVGRILADSTWHHWFDINLTGRFAPPSPYSGFDETPAGQLALKKIDAYFLNCGVWLASPARQTEMRNAAWWSILWTDRMVELSPATSLTRFGEEAIDALGKRASRCTVSEFIFKEEIFKEKIPRHEWPMLFDRFQLIDLPFERYVAGGILKQLLREAGPHNDKLTFPVKPIADDVLNKAIRAGTEEGLTALSKDLRKEARMATQLVESGFRTDAVGERIPKMAEEPVSA